MRKRLLIPLIVSIFSLGACSDNTMVINPTQEVDYVDLSNTTLSLAILAIAAFKSFVVSI